ncbi:hypothetical protein ATCC90586_000285 [Pythium insidiosum]|nr:hypothetical protein ATCC90586_000285 [Pythium insidiosum]
MAWLEDKEAIEDVGEAIAELRRNAPHTDLSRPLRLFRTGAEQACREDSASTDANEPISQDDELQALEYPADEECKTLPDLTANGTSAPIVVLTLAPSTALCPLRHAKTVQDAFYRWSIAAVRRRLEAMSIPLIALTTAAVGTDLQEDVHAGSALFELLEAMEPWAVVTDDGFSAHSRRELDAVKEHCVMAHANVSWPLLAIDSLTAVPFYQRIDIVRESLDEASGESEDHRSSAGLYEPSFLSEEAFGQAYVASMFPLDGEQSAELWSSCTERQKYPMHAKHEAAIQERLLYTSKKVGLDMLRWEIVDAMNAQGLLGQPVYTEQAALDRLEELLSPTDFRPAVQQELQMFVNRVYVIDDFLFALKTMEGLLTKCSIGTILSPDAIIVVLNTLFRVGSQDGEDAWTASSSTLLAFRERIELEISQQPKLSLAVKSQQS